MKSVSQRLPAALMIGILSVAGCGSGRVVLPFTLDTTTLTTSQTSRDFTPTEDAIRGISAILVRDLALPLPYTFTAYVYSDRHGFERGLVEAVESHRFAPLSHLYWRSDELDFFSPLALLGSRELRIGDDELGVDH